MRTPGPLAAGVAGGERVLNYYYYVRGVLWRGDWTKGGWSPGDYTDAVILESVIVYRPGNHYIARRNGRESQQKNKMALTLVSLICFRVGCWGESR